MFIATSVDGYIARTDGAVDWLDIVAQPGEDYGYAAFFDSVEALVLGRKTYDTVLTQGTWPYGGKRCIVLTHRRPTPLHGEEFREGPPRALLDALHLEGVRHVYVDGGDVIRQFLAAGLIDHVTLSIVPMLLGAGIPLFGASGVEQRWTLEDVRSYPSGLIQLRYRVL
ncbi:MAG: dihydrofolate reductase family protein [Deinococcales bacterium]